jgi:hypothetical protein
MKKQKQRKNNFKSKKLDKQLEKEVYGKNGTCGTLKFKNFKITMETNLTKQVFLVHKKQFEEIEGLLWGE